MTAKGIEFEIGKAIERIKDLDADKVLLQVPDGLKRDVDKIMDVIPADVDLWGGSCYGACDIPLEIDEDVLIHIGHSKIPGLSPDYPTVYLEGRDTRWNGIPDRIFEVLESRVALYSTVQYLEQMEKTSEILERKGLKTVRGEGDDRVKYPGQVLGCNYSVHVKDAASHLYIGTGRFHPLGMSMVIDKPIWIFDPVKGELSSIDEERDTFLRKRHASISKADVSKKRDLQIGIIVSRKPGQNRKYLAKRSKEKIPDNVKSTLIYIDEITPERIDDLGWDLMINTACPRITLDDSIQFKTPVLTPEEFLIAIREKDWEEWSMDEIH